MYFRTEGYQTTARYLPFSVLEAINDNKYWVVRSRGLEPPPVLPDSDLNAARLPVPPRPHKIHYLKKKTIRFDPGDLSNSFRKIKLKNFEPNDILFIFVNDSSVAN